MRPAIRVDNLSKQYRIGTRKHPGGRDLRESITDGARGLWRRLRGRGRPHEADAAPRDGEFWALKDVSFEVLPGQVVGVVGRNGAGKSTLLKILSRIVEPTSGRAEVRGRMGSLLEVGTGFHPELTGRENIYLNGSILGMTRREIARKFDEIVAFSEIEQFLETPVKRYSSGMYVRLAFAVAAHLEPEILVVDEVLAVGDAAFQRRCLGKMQQVSSTGRTILFVSHNMAAVRALCSRGILLDSGRPRQIGDVGPIVDAYVQSLAPPENAVQGSALPCFSPSKELGILAAELTPAGPDLVLKVNVHTARRFNLVGIGYTLKTLEGGVVASQGPSVNKVLLHDLCGDAEVTVTLRDALLLLNGGTYFLDLWVSYPGVEYIVKLDHLFRFDVPERDPYGCGLALTQRANGPLCLQATYQEQRLNGAW
jgi:ABC-type polysaccharide/polyol phosphate transport system ATPase subunit